MRAGFLTGVRAVEVRKISDARPERSDEAVVRVAHVGLCGTDLELYHGTSTYLKDERTTYPHLFGHEWVGTIEISPEIGHHGEHLKPGAIVTGSTMIACLTCDPCRSGHRNLCERLREVGLYGHPGAAAELLTMPAHTLIVIDEEADAVPHPEYVLIEPLATVLEGVARATPSPGDRVLVMGGGTIGTLAAMVFMQYPIDVEVFDPAAPPHLTELGIPTCGHPIDIDRTYDTVWECSGSASATQSVLSNLKAGGNAVFVGVPPVGTHIDVSKLTLNGHHLLGVRHGVDRYSAAARFIHRNREASKMLIEHIFALDEAGRAFQRLDEVRNRPKVVLKVE
jgi:possible L-threonine 3-dehydrogenase